MGSENDDHSNVADIKDTDGESGEKAGKEMGGDQVAKAIGACQGMGEHRGFLSKEVTQPQCSFRGSSGSNV